MDAITAIAELNSLADKRIGEQFENLEFGPTTAHVRHAKRPHLLHVTEPHARFNSLDLLNSSFYQANVDEADLALGCFSVNARFKDYDTRVSMSLPVEVRVPRGSSYNSFNFCDLFESFCDATEELQAKDLDRTSYVRKYFICKELHFCSLHVKCVF